jgi:hypothetical protein
MSAADLRKAADVLRKSRTLPTTPDLPVLLADLLDRTADVLTTTTILIEAEWPLSVLDSSAEAQDIADLINFHDVTS